MRVVVACLLTFSLGGFEFLRTVSEAIADDAISPNASFAADVAPGIGYEMVAPYPLNQVVDVQLENVSIRELADWIHEQFDVPVEILEDYEHDSAAWADETRISVNGYQQRLFTILLRAEWDFEDYELLPWFSVRDGILVVGPRHLMEDDRRRQTVHYDVSDLLDAGLEVETIKQVLFDHAGGWRAWAEVDGFGGTIDHYRGVLIIDQTEWLHRDVAYMLAVLRHPRVPVLRLYELEDDYENRLRLKHPITLSFTDVPLDEAVRRFFETAGIQGRLDYSAISEEGVDGTELVSLAADGITAEAALKSILENVDGSGLCWRAQDGVVKVTGGGCPLQATRLYDVSDFAVTEEQQLALNKMLMEQSNTTWNDGIGGEILQLEPGWVLIRDYEYVLYEIESLLAEWRSLGLNDPLLDQFPLVEDGRWRHDLVTHTYMMHADTAADMLSILPQRVAPGTWRDDDHPNAHGTITMVRLGMMDYTPEGAESDVDAEPIEFPAALLIIEHDQSNMDEVASELQSFSPDSWNTSSGEFRSQIPIQSVTGIGESTDGGLGFE